MAKKIKNKPKNKKTKEYLNEIRHLNVLLEYTVRNIDGRSSELDLLFTNQAKQIEQKIKKFKETNGLH